MPKGTARSHGSSGELVNHFNMIRIRVVGTGSLKMSFFSLDNMKRQDLPDISMSARTDIQPRKLANFKTQRASLQIGTNNINDYFRINRIIIYSRPIYSEYPG